MVIRKKATVAKHQRKPSVKGVSPSGSKAAKSKETMSVPAKLSDILSVIETPDVSSDIHVGHIVEVKPSNFGADLDEFFLGEVVARRNTDGCNYYYIHFLGEDPKIDDWLSECDVRALSSSEIEGRLGVKGLNAPFFGLSTFSATASASQPRSTIKSVRGVQLGNSVVLRAWYPSPYPEMVSCFDSYVKLCDTCLSYFRTTDELSRHWNYCSFSHPPGTEIYRDASSGVSVFEIDGEAFNGYCERLLLLAKLFLKEKRTFSQDASQYAQVRTFHFYVVCQWDAESGRAGIVGYISKLKFSARESNILSCILVLPHQQRKGFGSFLIDLAYAMAKIEGRVGSAERPLSELGRLSFYPYWMKRLVPHLSKTGETIILADLASRAGIVPDDAVEVLKHYGLLKEWGTAGVVVVVNDDFIAEFATKKSKGVVFTHSLLQWTPSYALS